jgi:Fe2+ or Zn2+ uptake regulation protein
VYKTLQTLQKVGLAGVVNAPHAEARYDAVTGIHHHAICTVCGGIEDLFDGRLDKLKAPRAAKGFAVASHSVHFHGVCRKCRARGRSKFNKLKVP